MKQRTLLTETENSRCLMATSTKAKTRKPRFSLLWSFRNGTEVIVQGNSTLRMSENQISISRQGRSAKEYSKLRTISEVLCSLSLTYLPKGIL